MRLEATDDAGTTTVFTLAVEPGTWLWDGFAYTAGWQVKHQVNYLTALIGANRASRSSVTVSGHTTDLVGESHCPTTSTTPFVDAEWGDTVTLEISVRIKAAYLVDGVCVNPRRGSEWRRSVTATFTLVQFRAGPIRIDVPLESDDDSDFAGGALAAVIQGTVRG